MSTPGDGRLGSAAATPKGWDVLARAAARSGSSEESELLLEFLAFTLDGDPYAIPVERVREIVRMRPVTAVPRVPPEVRGVISLRGEIVEVVDVRRRLGLGPATVTRATRIVVLHGDAGDVTGILVDGVTEVMRVTEEALRPAGNAESDFVSGLCERPGGRFVSLMNLERVLDLGRH